MGKRSRLDSIFGAYSSAVEHLSYTQAVIGSNPFAPKVIDKIIELFFYLRE